MYDLIVTGGRNKQNPKKGQGWAVYDAAIALKIKNDFTEKEILCRETQIPNYIKANVGNVYKSSFRRNDLVYLCMTTEIHIVSCFTGEIISKVTNSKFNDVHHALPYKDGLLVCSTGLDAVVYVDMQGVIVQTFPLTARSKQMLADEIDYRNIESTKPHELHPNYLFKVDDKVYVTCFKTSKAIPIDGSSEVPTYEVSRGNIHDGIVKGKSVWFTTTNGWLVEIDLRSATELRAINLNLIEKTKRPLGWCRGLCFVDDDNVVVGFSRLRKTKSEENLRWVANKFLGVNQAPLPTRLVLYNLNKLEKVNEWVLEEGSEEINSVFSILL